MFRKFFHLVNLKRELDDFEQIHADIEKAIVFKGTNLWILILAILVASVGLNVNSTAVIIGAMLISPLMGPINGMGYSIAIYNIPLFRQALKNYTFAVIASLITSTLYFTISPISTAHSELLARTTPTIYDVLIALVGGTAGILAISSKQKGNVIPGVAIATALMPPICTAGYGLASGHFTYFFGAFYLFTINTVFIGLASLIMSQILKFPIRTIEDSVRKEHINRWITFVISITLIPSIYFGYVMVQNEHFSDKATRYTKSITLFEGNYLLKYDVNARKKIITLIYGGNPLTSDQKTRIINRRKDFELDKTTVEIKQGLAINNLLKATDEEDNLKSEINRLNIELSLREKQRDSVSGITKRGKQILGEISALYPQIISCTYSEAETYNQEQAAPQRTALVVFTANRKESAISKTDKEKISNWLSQKLKRQDVIILYE